MNKSKCIFLRWELCKKCIEEKNTLAVYESGTEVGGNGDTIPFEPLNIIREGMERGKEWRNPMVTVRANQPMFAVNYELCRVCPYEMEHWLFYEESREREKSESQV